MASKFKITKALLAKIIKWAGNGLDKKDIAHLLGYSPNHWYVMMKNHDELTQAYNVGRSEQKSLLENKMQQIALNARLDRDAVAAGQYLLNRHHPVEQASTTVEVSITTDDDIKSEIMRELNG